MFIRTRSAHYGIQTNAQQDLQLLGPHEWPYVCVGGSISHGTADSTSSFSDIDLKGFYVAGEDHYLGIKRDRETIRGEVEVEGTKIESEMHEVQKFASLALSCNPTVIETLFVDPKFHIRVSPWAGELLDIRHAFLSTRAFDSFNGYAKQQLINMSKDNMSTRKLGVKRKAIIEKYGYDVKNGAHLLRLLYMGIELAKTGTITVERPEKDLLLDVKRGKYTLPQVQKMGEDLFAEFRSIEASGKFELPSKPDIDLVNDRVKEIIKEQLNLVYCEE